jgi:hypothetical protein
MGKTTCSVAGGSVPASPSPGEAAMTRRLAEQAATTVQPTRERAAEPLAGRTRLKPLYVASVHRRVLHDARRPCR